MQTCPQCSRHVLEGEPRCPFCAASFVQVSGSAPVLLSALVGLTLVACGGGDPDGEASGTIGGTTTNGASNTSAVEMTTTAPLTTSDTAPTSTSEGTTGTSATSTVSGTETSGDPTSSGSETSSTSETGGTSGETGGDTVQMTTGGACMGAGEELCDGVCVNTQEDPMHCGDCETACAGDEFCIEGQCMIILPPYGAPMPEPLWV